MPVAIANLAALRDTLRNATRVVFFTGAGMSAESGIATFRDALTGLWERFDPTMLASVEGFIADPALVWGWYEWRRMNVMHAQPNAGHVAIAHYAARHPEKAIRVVTQNVDDLHERGGCVDVIHLHGSILAPRCFDCDAPAPASIAMTVPTEPEGGRRLAPPRCAHCGGALRPGVVWFGEALPARAFTQARSYVREAEVLVVVGTSGVVEPAASLVRQAADAGAYVIRIDPQATVNDASATTTVNATAVQAMPLLLAD